MHAFDFVILLLSFVYAIALTHLLTRVGSLVMARERVRFSSLLAMMMINSGFMIFANWLLNWTLRDVQGWDVLSVLVQFLFAMAIYFLSLLSAPEPQPDGLIDMEAFYWKQYRPYYATVVVLFILAILANLDFMKTSDPWMALKQNGFILPMFAIPALALMVRARWAQWLAAAGLFASQLSFLVLFNATMS